MAPQLNLSGFHPSAEANYRLVAEGLRRALLEGRPLPALRSPAVEIVWRPKDCYPLYQAYTAHEEITLCCAENAPAQFAYQLAHELGHMTARADIRFERRDGCLWVEEVVCGAYSLIGLQSLCDLDDWWRIHGAPYLDNLVQGAYNPAAVSPAFMAARKTDFLNARTLIDDGKLVSGAIFNAIAPDQIISDNIALGQTPLSPSDVVAFLQDWRTRCNGTRTTPELLLAILG